MSMDKFGVDTQDPDAGDPDHKTADAKGDIRCPKCGALAVHEGYVILCPVHGSEPFEPRK